WRPVPSSWSRGPGPSSRVRPSCGWGSCVLGRSCGGVLLGLGGCGYQSSAVQQVRAGAQGEVGDVQVLSVLGGSDLESGSGDLLEDAAGLPLGRARNDSGLFQLPGVLRGDLVVGDADARAPAAV